MKYKIIALAKESVSTTIDADSAEEARTEAELLPFDAFSKGDFDWEITDIYEESTTHTH